MSKIFWFIFSIAFIYRLWGINNPLLDFHSWRQTGTASISRNFYEGGMNIFKPQLDTIPEGNIKALYAVEFQLYPYLVALFYFIFGAQDWIGRLVSVLFGMGALFYIYFIAKKYYDEKIALWASGFYAVLPMAVFYNRTFQPEAAMLFFSIAGIYHFSEWAEHCFETKENSILNWHYFYATLFTLCAFLVKIPTLYLMFPLFYLVFYYWNWNIFKMKSL